MTRAVCGLVAAALLFIGGCASVQESEPAADIALPPAAINPLPGSSWVAATIMGQPADSATSTVVFSTDGRISGNTGCNNYNGGVELAADTLDIGLLASTRMMCAPAVSGQEIVFLEALGMAQTWQQAGDELLLYDESGATIMQLVPPTD